MSDKAVLPINIYVIQPPAIRRRAQDVELYVLKLEHADGYMTSVRKSAAALGADISGHYMHDFCGLYPRAGNMLQFHNFPPGVDRAMYESQGLSLRDMTDREADAFYGAFRSANAKAAVARGLTSGSAASLSVPVASAVSTPAFRHASAQALTAPPVTSRSAAQPTSVRTAIGQLEFDPK